MKIKKKELIIGIVAIVLIVAIGIAYGISKPGIKADEPKKIEKTAKKENKKEKSKVSKADRSEDKKTDAKSDARDEVKKKEDSGDKAAKSENNGTKTSSNPKSSTHNANTPSHSSSSGSGSAPAPKPKRWVVDQAAWDETVQEPLYAYRPTWWVHYENGTNRTFYSENEAVAEATNNINAASWGNGQDEQYISGYTTKVIHHDEVGHWE